MSYDKISIISEENVCLLWSLPWAERASLST